MGIRGFLLRLTAAFRLQVRDLTMANARLMLDLDNSQLATEDFRVKSGSPFCPHDL